MRRLASIMCVAWVGGCASSQNVADGPGIGGVAPWVSRRGDVSMAASPTITETYVIEGLIRSAGPTGEPVANAVVCAFAAGRFHARSISDRDGRFRLAGDAGRPPAVVEVGSNLGSGETAKMPAPTVVEHSFVSVRAHPHYSVEIVVRHPDFAPFRTELEVPRDTRASPPEFLLRDGKSNAAPNLDTSCPEDDSRAVDARSFELSP